MAAVAVPIRGAFRAPQLLGLEGPAVEALAPSQWAHRSVLEAVSDLPVEGDPPVAEPPALPVAVVAREAWEGHSQAKLAVTVAPEPVPPSQGQSFNTAVVAVVGSMPQAVTSPAEMRVWAVPEEAELAERKLCRRMAWMQRMASAAAVVVDLMGSEIPQSLLVALVPLAVTAAMVLSSSAMSTSRIRPQAFRV